MDKKIRQSSRLCQCKQSKRRGELTDWLLNEKENTEVESEKKMDMKGLH